MDDLMEDAMDDMDYDDYDDDCVEEVGVVGIIETWKSGNGHSCFYL